MIYLVSNKKQLFEDPSYIDISIEDAINKISQFTEIEFDSETEGLSEYTNNLLCTQYGLGEDQIVIDNTYIPIERLKKVLENPNLTLLGWNLAFDLKFLYKHNIFPYKVWDGMIAERVLFLGYSPLDHSLSLKSAALNYLNIDIDKSVRGQIITQGLTVPVIKYAAGDVTYIKRIREKQIEALNQKQLLKAAKFEMGFVPVMAYFTHCGAKLDVKKWTEKIKSDQEKVRQAERELNQWVENYYLTHKGIQNGYIRKSTESVNFQEEIKLLSYTSCSNVKRITDGDLVHYEYDELFPYIVPFIQQDLFEPVTSTVSCVIKWSSSQQVIPLFEHLGINCDTIDSKTKQPKKSAEIKIVEPQISKCSIIPIYIKYKKAKILIDTFGQKFIDKINPISHRIHPDYFSLGADTGRVSATNPSLMNLPHDALTRSCFIAEEGNKWISADYTGQESFLMASIANDKAMLEELIHGSGDLHSLTAKMVFKDIIPQDATSTEIKENFHEYRQDAKGYEFCFNYSGNDKTLVQTKGISPDKAREIYENYMSGFCGLRDYQEFRRKDVIDKGYILINSITGHKSFVYDWDKLFDIIKCLDSPEESFMMKSENKELFVANKKYLNFRLKEIMKQSVNFPIQGTGALCFKLACIKFFKWIRDNHFLNIIKLCVPCHDEINCEAPIDIADGVSKILVKCMEEAGAPFCTRAKLTADVSINYYWVH